MKNKKVIFIDYDGTLYHQSNDCLYEEVYELFDVAKKNNIDIYLTTGRTMLYLKNNPRLLKLLRGVIGANGSSIYEDNILIHKNYINKQDMKELDIYTKEHNISIVYFSDIYAYVNFKEEEVIERFINFNKVPVKKINTIDEISDEIELVCLYTDAINIDPMIDKFNNVTIYKWGSRGADVIKKGLTKGTGIKTILMNNEYTKSYGIGDGLNDIEMFENVDVSIAMGNASDEVKKHAKIVTNSLFERGVEQILEKIIKNEI